MVLQKDINIIQKPCQCYCIIPVASQTNAIHIARQCELQYIIPFWMLSFVIVCEMNFCNYYGAQYAKPFYKLLDQYCNQF